jgi:DNA-binding GntR family transcriptional regulator
MDLAQIYEALEEKIVWLELKPGSTFNLSELAKLFGVSRCPITLVLTRLEAEGWAVRHGSHFGVSPLSLDRIKETVEIRLVLEVQANVWTMNRITAEEMNELEQVQQEIGRLTATASNREMLELDLKFHRIIFRAAKNAQLAEFLDRILGTYFRFWLSIPCETEPQGLFAETLEVINAFKAKDEAGLRNASRKHIRRSYEGIVGGPIGRHSGDRYTLRRTPDCRCR